MQKQFKQWMLLAAVVPTFAMAQSLQNQDATQAPAAAAPAAAPDPAKQAAIKNLLDAIDAQKLVGAIGNSAQMQAKQLVPAILSDALSENKTMNDKQKQASVPDLQRMPYRSWLTRQARCLQRIRSARTPCKPSTMLMPSTTPPPKSTT